jgi:hypothetical protein
MAPALCCARKRAVRRKLLRCLHTSPAADFGLNHLPKHLERQRPDQRPPVDQESRRPLHSQGFPGRDVRPDSGRILTRGEAGVERLAVQPQLDGEPLQVVLAEGSPVLARLAFVQPVVVRPKSSLLGGALAGLGRLLRLRAEKSIVQVAKAGLARFDVRLIDLALRASGKTPAVWSLEVAEFDDGNRRLSISLKVAGLGHDSRHHTGRQGSLAGSASGRDDRGSVRGPRRHQRAAEEASQHAHRQPDDERRPRVESRLIRSRCRSDGIRLSGIAGWMVCRLIFHLLDTFH